MKKCFSTTWCAWLLILCGVFISGSFATNSLQAQTVTGPEQDCFAALPVTRSVIVQQLSYAGAGTNANDIGSGVGCVTTPETNSVWYRLVVGVSGTLAFTITPNNATDDYNFVVFRAPAGTTGFSSCQGSLSELSSRVIRCNFRPGAGLTGVNTASQSVFPNAFEPSVGVSAGDIILINVNNASMMNTSGFTIDFGASTAGVIPTGGGVTQPTLNIRAVQTQTATGCGAPSVINLTFSQPMLRGSIQPSSFVIQNADGTRTFNVTQVSCVSCSNDNTGATTFALTISPALTESGVYRVTTSATAGVVIPRLLNNAPLVLPAQTFTVNVGTIIPTLQIGNGTPRNTPQTTSFCLAQSTRLTVEDGGPNSQYQWIREIGGVQTILPNQTGRSLNVFGRYSGDDSPTNDTVFVELNQTGRFFARVTDANGCMRISSNADVNVFGGRQASITANNRVFASGTSPRNLTICRNDGVSLVAEAGFRTYLWSFNGRPIDTARGRTLFARDLGLYTVETTDENGCRNRPADIVVIPFDTPTPSITGPDVNCPNPATGRIETSVTLTASVNPAYRSYQWLDSNGRAIPNATGNTLSVRTGTFSLVVTTPENCQLTVTKTVRPGINPGIVNILNDALGPITLCPGGSQLLQASSQFTSYRWFRNSVEIPGATQRTYTATETGSYQVQGVGPDGCATALSMPPLIVQATVVAIPTILPAGGLLRFCRGTSIRLSVSGGDNFEWLFGNERVPFATTREVTVNREGQYTVRITFNSPTLAGCAVTSTATVQAVDNPVPPVLNPASDSTFCSGSSLVLRTEPGFDSYQWLRDGTPIQGATMPNFAVNVTGNYTVRVTAFGGCVGTSATRRVTEIPSPNVPMIGSNNEFLVCPNGSTEIFVSNVQSGVTYQWFREGQEIPGATNARLTVTQRGNYLVEARSPNGCTSRPMSPSLVDTTALPTPPTLPRTLVICPNASTTVDAGAGFMTYQWTLNGADIMGATQRTYAIRAGGRYNVRVSNMRGCINTSADIIVTQTAVLVTITPIDSGVRFRANSTPPPQRYQWLRNGMNIPGAIDSVFAPQAEGTYNVRVTDINGCADTSRTPFNFVLPRLTITPIPPGTTPPSGIPPSSANVAVRGDTLIAAPGDTVVFGLRLATIGSLRPGARMSGSLCFNATLLEPLPPLMTGTISAGVRCIPISFTIPQDLSQAALFLPFRAALGNDSLTVLLLRDVRLVPDGAPVNSVFGNFRLSNISYAGGARLIGPPPRMRLAPTAQNPTSDVAVVKYTLENASATDAATPVLPVQITMSDVFGRTVKTSDIQVLVGETGEVRMNVQDLVPGVYFMIVRSKDGAAVQRIHIVR